MKSAFLFFFICFRVIFPSEKLLFFFLNRDSTRFKKKKKQRKDFSRRIGGIKLGGKQKMVFFYGVVIFHRIRFSFFFFFFFCFWIFFPDIFLRLTFNCSWRGKTKTNFFNWVCFLLSYSFLSFFLFCFWNLNGLWNYYS